MPWRPQVAERFWRISVWPDDRAGPPANSLAGRSSGLSGSDNEGLRAVGVRRWVPTDGRVRLCACQWRASRRARPLRRRRTRRPAESARESLTSPLAPSAPQVLDCEEPRPWPGTLLHRLAFLSIIFIYERQDEASPVPTRHANVPRGAAAAPWSPPAHASVARARLARHAPRPRHPLRQTHLPLRQGPATRAHLRHRHLPAGPNRAGDRAADVAGNRDALDPQLSPLLAGDRGDLHDQSPTLATSAPSSQR